MNIYDIKDRQFVDSLNKSLTEDAIKSFNDKSALDDGTQDGKNRRRMSMYDNSGRLRKTIFKGAACTSLSRWSEIEDIIQHEARQYVNSISTRPVKDGSYWNCWSWFNVLTSEDTYAWHAHNKYFISSAYYPDVGDGSTPIIFKSPLANIINTWWPSSKFGINNRWVQEEIIYPKNGDLIIFPAWLEHTVNKPHHGLGRDVQGQSFGIPSDDLPVEDPDKFRISITCNFRNEFVAPE